MPKLYNRPKLHNFKCFVSQKNTKNYKFKYIMIAYIQLNAPIINLKQQ